MLISLFIVLFVTVSYFACTQTTVTADYIKRFTIKELSEIAEDNNGILPYEFLKDIKPFKINAEANEKWCILLVNFPDAKHSQPNSYFDEQMVSGRNSLSQYYLQNSYGRLIVDTGTKVLGPITISGNSKSYEYIEDMVEDAIKSAINQDDKFFAYYDDNGDGYPENSIVVFPGEWSTVTKYKIPTSGYRNLKGTVLFTQGDPNSDAINWPVVLLVQNLIHNVSILQHEDDIYVGGWDIMDTGYFKNCIGLSSYSKFKVGWIDIKEITKPGEYEVDALGGEGQNKAYKIPIPGSEKEFILIENRQKVGSDSLMSGIQNEGLIIYHLNENRKYEEGLFNAKSKEGQYPGLQVLDRSSTGNSGIVSWDTWEAYTFKPGATFNNDSRRTSIDATTTVNTLPYGKNVVRETITIYDISKSGPKMTFKLRYDKPSVPIVNVDETVPFAKVEKGTTKTLKLNFRNIGSGNIKVFLKPSVPWIAIDRSNFIGTDEDINVTVDTKTLKYGVNTGYIFYSGTSEGQVRVTVDVAPVTGDINVDSSVDDLDVELLRQHLGDNKSQITFDRVHDLDKNGEVNGGDLIALAKNYKTKFWSLLLPSR